MYWNSLYRSRPTLCPTRLIETWDVLKFRHLNHHLHFCFLINRNMRCIEISDSAEKRRRTIPINRNMRCIEMRSNNSGSAQNDRLIETWDVLKFLHLICGKGNCVINRNMRCIEIIVDAKLLKKSVSINRNMRCIEICCFYRKCDRYIRLIETWDVLK